MGLLNYLTATSMDEDYAEVSRRHAQQGRPRQGKAGSWGLLALALFGVLVATAAVETARNAPEAANSHSSLVAQVHDRKQELASMRVRARRLRSEVHQLQVQDLQATAEGRALQDRLVRLRVAAGMVAVRGPGVRIVVDDAPGGGEGGQVLDKDLQKMANGLWLAGAEAIAINGQRISSLTAIREAADGITVNFRHVNAPYTVSAIGNPNKLGTRFIDTAGGQTWLALRSAYGLRFDINSEDSMKLPAAPRQSLRHAEPLAPQGRGR